MQKLITDVFSLKFTDNSNPKTFDHFTDVGIPQSLQPINLPNGTHRDAGHRQHQLRGQSDAANFEPAAADLQSAHSRAADRGDPSSQRLPAYRTRRQDSQYRSTPTSAVIKVNCADINPGDLPTASAKFGSFTYQNAAHSDVTATLNAQQLADIAAIEVNLVAVPDPGNTNNGSATWTYSFPDNAFDFLAAGETLTLTYTVEVDNNFAPNDEITMLPFTITITGTNDVPVITSGPQTIAFSGGTSVPGGPLTTNVPTIGNAGI